MCNYISFKIFFFFKIFSNCLFLINSQSPSTFVLYTISKHIQKIKLSTWHILFPCLYIHVYLLTIYKINVCVCLCVCKYKLYSIFFYCILCSQFLNNTKEILSVLRCRRKQWPFYLENLPSNRYYCPFNI